MRVRISIVLLLVLPVAAWAQGPALPGGERWLPDENAGDTDVLHYDLAIEVDPGTHWLSGSNRITVCSRVDGLSSFRFQLSDAYTINDLRVDDVVAGWTRADEANIDVTLPAPQADGATFTVYVAYSGYTNSGTLASTIQYYAHNGNPAIWTFSCPYYACTWWPVKEANDDKATADLAFTVPDTMVVASNGALQSVDAVGVNQTRYVWKTDYPIAPYLICFAATNFARYDTVWPHDGTTMPLTFYIYPESNGAAVHQALDKVADMLTVFSQLFGTYPFVNEKYGIYQWQMASGMEHQTMTGQYTLTSEGMTVHELAHEWWGDAVTCATWHDAWLNEGFATYSEALWAEYQSGSSGTPALHAYMATLRPSSTAGTVYVYDISSFDAIFNLDTTYLKAAWVLHALRHVVGEEGFWDIVAAWRAAYEGSAATTADFERICEDTTGHDLAWFFNEWVYQSKLPRYYYAWQDHVIGGQHYLEIFLRQDPMAVFTMPVDFAVTTATGTATYAVWSDAYREHHLIPLGTEAVAAVAFDPAPWFLRRDAAPTTFTAGPPKIVTLDPAPDGVRTGDVATLAVGFHKDVVASAADFTLVGKRVGVVPVTVTYDPANFVVTLTPAAPLSPDWYTLTVADTVVAVADGAALDGELTKIWFPEPLPSGNGQAGGAAVSSFVVVAPGAGDMNCDGQTNANDISAFVLALLSGEAGYNATYPDCDYMLADLNADGVVNFADINTFVALLTQ